MITYYIENMNKFAIFDLHHWYTLMANQSIITAYLGNFDHFTTTSLLQNFKKRMSDLETSTAINKRIYKIMVESIENIGRHKVSKIVHCEVPSDSAIFLLAKQQNVFYISTGNYIEENKVETLRQKIDTINGFNRTDLKKYYKQVLLESKQNNTIGAGIGLIDIVLKTGKPLKYCFLKISEQYSFFILEATITNKNK